MYRVVNMTCGAVPHLPYRLSFSLHHIEFIELDAAGEGMAAP